MLYMEKLLRVFHNPWLVFKFFANKGIFRWMPDETYLKCMFRSTVGRKLNLSNPQLFNEKLQWLKLHDRNPMYTIMADKVKAKDYVAEKIGREYIIPTLGVWDNADDVDFSSLPDRFVIKCNHNSGKGMYICRDKSKMDERKVREGLRRGLAEDYYKHGREWPYKDIPRRILAEQYMEDESGYELKDYKVFNFNGEPELIEVDFDSFINHRRNFYSTDWKRLELEIQYRSDSSREIARPEHLDEMLDLCRRLSAGIPHVRTDFYVINGRLYFGELTFFHGSGMERFSPAEWDGRLGHLIELPVSGVNYLIDNKDFMVYIGFARQSGGLHTDVGGLRDYKFFCFNGQPKFMYVSNDYSKNARTDFFDMNYTHLDMRMKDPNSENPPAKPDEFDEMKALAVKLSKGIPFLRVDFYIINHKIYFGELTFYHNAGFFQIYPFKWNGIIGDWVQLDGKDSHP